MISKGKSFLTSLRPPKCNRINHEKHSFDLEEARVVFSGLLLTAPDKRQDYGEKRMDDSSESVVLVAVRTSRNGRIRPISARKADSRERRACYQRLSEATKGD